MVGTLYVIGLLIILFGVIAGFSTPSGLPFVGGAIVSGVFFMALGKIVELLERIEQKLPNQSNSNPYQMQEYAVVSSDFEVYESKNETYQFFTLNGSNLIQARVFKKYIEIDGDKYLFKLPNKESQEFIKHNSYNLSAAMFTKDSISFINLSALGINASLMGNQIVLSYSKN
ncbi:hypothetical protein [Paenibacillus alba]|uniref:Uncharacterized protein n=1 Tax=Paenibacillus alba TaxID=1197127 RepID=A0ABU6G4E2_9BACL|nr:hypothetical protein [Paenibacillus alba]MEC0229039.1 hypothetical protein [Paenibacillus alba]